MDKIRETLLTALTECVDFHPDNEARRNQYPQGLEEVGFLFRTFRLSWCLSWCDIERTNEHRIWSILDELHKKRQIKLHRISINKSLDVNDILMVAEIGTGVRTWVNGARHIVHKVYYWQEGKVLTEDEFSSRGIVARPSQVVGDLRRQRDEAFQKTFGKGENPEIIKQLDFESIQAEAEYRRDIAIIADWIRGQKGKKKRISIEPFNIDEGERH